MINTIIVRGERNSGTNYLSRLIQHYLPGICIEDGSDTSRFKWKHAFWTDDLILENSDLIIVICKDIYSWLISMEKSPYHIPYRCENFIEFALHEYYSIAGKYYKYYDLHYGKEQTQNDELMIERDCDGKRFKNLFELRTAKYTDWLGLKKLTPNFHFIQYERLLKNPVKEINKISRLYKIEYRNTPFDHTYERYKYYSNREYLDCYSKKYLDIVQQNVDTDLEEYMGYKILGSSHRRFRKFFQSGYWASERK